jgi:hypothetical protein
VGKHVAADGRVTADAGAVDAALHVDEAAIRKLGAPRILDNPVVTLGCVRAIAFEERRRRRRRKERKKEKNVRGGEKQRAVLCYFPFYLFICDTNPTMVVLWSISCDTSAHSAAVMKHELSFSHPGTMWSNTSALMP